MTVEEHYEFPDDVKILVATPNYTNLFDANAHVNHVDCAVEWTKWGLDFNWTVIGRTFVQFARTQLCQVAVDGNFTHIFWVDDDAVIKPDFLPRFLSHGKDVVIAPYPLRKMPHQIGVLKSRTGDYHDHQSYDNLTLEDMDQGLIEIDGGGTHCMLMSVESLLKQGEVTDHQVIPDVIQKIFGMLSDEDQRVAQQYVGNPSKGFQSFAEEDTDGVMSYFVMPKSGTEDMYWCYRAKRKGIEIWCDTDVFADHIGFNPVITRKWREYAEKCMASGDLVESKRIQIIPGDENLRNTDGVVRDSTVNLA